MESSEDGSAPTTRIIFVEVSGGTKATHGNANAKKRVNTIKMKKVIIGCRSHPTSGDSGESRRDRCRARDDELARSADRDEETKRHVIQKQGQ